MIFIFKMSLFINNCVCCCDIIVLCSHRSDLSKFFWFLKSMFLCITFEELSNHLLGHGQLGWTQSGVGVSPWPRFLNCELPYMVIVSPKKRHFCPNQKLEVFLGKNTFYLFVWSRGPPGKLRSVSKLGFCGNIWKNRKVFISWK